MSPYLRFRDPVALPLAGSKNKKHPNFVIMQTAEQEFTIKVVRGSESTRRQPTLWQRFDRLQRSLAPLRKGRHIKRGIHYETES